MLNDVDNMPVALQLDPVPRTRIRKNEPERHFARSNHWQLPWIFDRSVRIVSAVQPRICDVIIDKHVHVVLEAAPS